MSPSRHLTQLAAVAVLVLVSLRMTSSEIEAHEVGWKVKANQDIYVHNNTAFEGSAEMRADYNSTDLNVYAGYYQGRTNVGIVAGNWCDMGSLLALAQVNAIVGTAWKPCSTYPDGRATGNCGGDVRAEHAWIVINTCNPDMASWRAAGGKYFDRRLLTHEMGHVVGLAHVNCGYNSVMELTYCFTPNSFINKLMSHDVSDINGMY